MDILFLVFEVSAPLRSSQSKRPPDVLRRLALSKEQEKDIRMDILFLFSRSPLRFGRCRTNVPRTFCNVSRSIKITQNADKYGVLGVFLFLKSCRQSLQIT